MNNRRSKSYGPSERENRFSSSDLLGFGIIALVLLAFAGLWYWKSEVEGKLVPYDKVVGCPVGGPFATTVLLLDLTDKVSFLQEQQVIKFAESLANLKSDNAVGMHERAILVLLKESHNSQLPIPVVSVCNPGDGSDLDEFTGNPGLAKKRFEERFLSPIKDAISTLVEVQPAGSSPIIESIRGIGVSSFFTSPKTGHKNRLIVISDMIQNSNNISFYRDGLVLNDKALQTQAAELDEVEEAELYVIGREQLATTQGKELIEFWSRYFRFSGTTLSSAERWTE
jgi:hypothetical protein